MRLFWVSPEICAAQSQSSTVKGVLQNKENVGPLPQSLLLEILQVQTVWIRGNIGGIQVKLLLPFSQHSILHQDVLELSCKLYRSASQLELISSGK